MGCFAKRLRYVRDVFTGLPGDELFLSLVAVKRRTLFLLLFVLGILHLRILLVDVDFFAHGDCQEFGHIHLPNHIHKVSSLENLENNIDSGARSKSTAAKDECREGKSVFHISLLPENIFETLLFVNKLKFDLVFSLENQPKDPFLEPKRKPPRFA